MPHLKMRRGPAPGQEFDLNLEQMTIGRGRKNEIIVDDNEVSREHARLVRVLDDYEIHDLGSLNGTFVNGQRVDEGGWLLDQPCIIELGDSITLEYYPGEYEAVDTEQFAANSLNADDIKQTYLVIRSASSDVPEVYQMDGDNISIGRDMENDIVLQDAEVSRFHLRFHATENGYLIEDLGSLNGTFVNENRLINSQPLNLEDHITIGTMVEMWYTTAPKQIVNLDVIDTSPLTSTKTPEDSDPTRKRRPTKVTQSTLTDENVPNVSGMALNALEGHIFLAYAREDWDGVVGHLYAYLDDNDIPVWVDQHLTPNTDEWVNAIEQAQAECLCLLVVVSPKAIKTPYVKKSLRRFVGREKPMLLVEYKPVERLPISVQNAPMVDFNHADPQQTFNFILGQLRRLGL